MNETNWKGFINSVLLESKQFEKISSESVGETEIEKFRSNKNPETEIKVGYLEDERLIFFIFYNPNFPGHNKYSENEYFYRYDFDEKKSYGNPGLDFTEINRNGILSMLKNGLKGKEIKFLRNNKVVKSQLYLSESQPNFSYSFYFRKRSLIEKLFGKYIENEKDFEKIELSLSEIFSGM
jgi:hypothetical protein